MRTATKLWDVTCGHCGYVAGKVAYRERIRSLEVEHPSHKWSVYYHGMHFFECSQCKRLVAGGEECPYC